MGSGPMSWLVARSPLPLWLPLTMATCLQMTSTCDPQSPDEIPVISPPDLAAVLAAQDVTDVLLAEVTALLVTISIEEKALAPAAPLLRVPYLERLLEAVRDARHWTACQMPFGLRSCKHMMTSPLTSRRLSWRCLIETNYAACKVSCSPSGALRTC